MTLFRGKRGAGAIGSSSHTDDGGAEGGDATAFSRQDSIDIVDIS